MIATLFRTNLRNCLILSQTFVGNSLQHLLCFLEFLTQADPNQTHNSLCNSNSENFLQTARYSRPDLLQKSLDHLILYSGEHRLNLILFANLTSYIPNSCSGRSKVHLWAGSVARCEII